MIPFALYVAFAALVGTWIIDDAGISYAYARNFASGHGFVSQPGVPPVEGFSNFLWVVLLSPLLLVRAFDPVFVPKLVSAALVLATMWIVQRSLQRETGSAAPGLFAAAALAVSPPIVIWTMSGLENALTLFLGAAYAVQLADRPKHWAVKAGVLASLLAMTHPELLLLSGTGFIMCLVTAREEPRKIAHFAGTFAILTGAFFAFRLVTFGLPLPHTYYAKRTTMSAFERLSQLIQHPQAQLWDRTMAVAQGLGGVVGIVATICLAGALVTLVARRAATRAVLVWSLLALNALAAFLWIDDDWMGEYRFATAVILAVIVAVTLAADGIVRMLQAKRAIGAAVAVVAVALMAAIAVPRVKAFTANPPTPYADVERRIARQFDAYAAALAVDRPSILVADIGATLFETRLRVYDLAGLCEPDVVHTLKADTPAWRFEHPAFYDWVFEKIKPTFISTNKFWTYVPAFEKDPRFRRDYVAINTYADGYLQRTFGVMMRSGDFVRRDVLRSAGDVERMRRAYQPAPRPDMDLDEGAAMPAVATAARTLDEAGRPHDARGLWQRIAARGVSGADPASYLEALDRLGDSRPVTRLGDALDAEMNSGVRQLYTEGQPEQALAIFDSILAANPSHYGAQFQRARALTMLGRKEQTLAAWQTVALLAARISDQQTTAIALAELRK